MTPHHRPNSLLRTITCQLILMLHSYDPGMLLSTHLGSVDTKDVLGINLKRTPMRMRDDRSDTRDPQTDGLRRGQI